MMNGIGINVNSGVNVKSNYQLAFRAKGEKAVYEVVDKINDAAVDFINKDRPLAEKREKLIRDTLLKLRIKCPFIGKKVKPEEAKIEHITPSIENNKLIEFVDETHLKAYLEELKERDPEGYKAALRRFAEEKVAMMSTWEILKEIAKNIFKKS